MTNDRIFAPRDRGGTQATLTALTVSFAVAVVLACVVERGPGSALVVLFAVPALAFGLLVGRWWVLLVPVLLTASAIAAGVECSVSEQPQALMLAGALVGVVVRQVGDRVVGR